MSPSDSSHNSGVAPLGVGASQTGNGVGPTGAGGNGNGGQNVGVQQAAELTLLYKWIAESGIFVILLFLHFLYDHRLGKIVLKSFVTDFFFMLHYLSAFSFYF